MLENILENINKNLERIATAIEIKVGLDEKHRQEKATNNNDINCENPTKPIENTVTTLGSEIVTEINAIPQAIPVQAQTESFTQDQLAVAMSNAVSAGKMNVVMGVLSKFNVQALTQINPADYNNLATMLRESGVNV